MGKGADEKDFYDVSIVDGYNLPFIAAPQGVSGVCNATGCVSDLNTGCPKELQVVDRDNGGVGVVGCRSACEAFGLDQYCCSGEFANRTTCRPASYSLFSRLLVRELIAMHLMMVPALSLARLPIMPSSFAPISLLGKNLTWHECRTKRSNGAVLIPAPPMIQFQHTINREISDMVSSSNILWPIPLMSIIIIILLSLNLFFQKQNLYLRISFSFLYKNFIQYDMSRLYLYSFVS